MGWLFHEQSTATGLVAVIAVFAAAAYGASWILYFAFVAARRRFSRGVGPSAGGESRLAKTFNPLIMTATLAVVLATLGLKGYLIEQIKEQPCGSFVAPVTGTKGCCP